MSSVNKGRGKYRFNIVDIILIAVIVLAVASMLFLYFYDGTTGDGKSEQKTVKIIYTVELSGLDDIFRGKISMGDSVLAEDGEYYIGHVIDVEYTDAVYRGYDSDGKAFEQSYPGKIDVKAKISADAIVDEDGFYSVDGYTVSVGRQADIRFPYYTGMAECISLSEVSE